MESGRMTEARAAESVSKGRVLIVDDDPLVLKAYARIVANDGFDVQPTEDGSTALARLGKESFDCVLSDISMPGMSGLQLLRAVRRLDLDIPVVLMTGDPNLSSAVEALEHGALRYLLKPVEPTKLLHEVEYAVRLCRVARLKRQAMHLLGAPVLELGDRASLDARFANALEGLWIAYQPIVRWSQRKVIGYEALARTTEPTLAQPLDLFDAGERLGRLQELSRAIRANIGSAECVMPPGCTLFVNLHPQDFLDDTLAEWVGNIPSDRVILEITERAPLESINDLPGRTARLRGRGFRIALDDLGAGYAGLSSFAQLDPEVVKLDMSFVRGVEHTPVKQRLIVAIIDLCRQLGAELVVEGVETRAERDTLVSLGCDVFQGFIFARPANPFPDVRWD
jgi:EAL domain-containing protein (putative c-di-GMP-specific phosphodiesterase class I)